MTRNKLIKKFDKEYPSPCSVCNFDRDCQVPCEDFMKYEKTKEIFYTSIEDIE